MIAHLPDVPPTMDAGFRAMTHAEFVQLSLRTGSTLDLLDRETDTLVTAVVRGFRDDGLVVQLSDGPVALQYADEEIGETHGPRSRDLRYLVVRSSESDFARPMGAAAPLASADCDLPVVLRASNQLAAIRRHVRDHAVAIDRTANYVQGLPTRAEYDAVVADLETLRTQLRALSLGRAS